MKTLLIVLAVIAAAVVGMVIRRGTRLRILLPAGLLLLACSPPAEARLGETPEQLMVRYGHPTKKTPGKWPVLEFANNDFTIRVVFMDGLSAEETARSKHSQNLISEATQIARRMANCPHLSSAYSQGVRVRYHCEKSCFVAGSFDGSQEITVATEKYEKARTDERHAESDRRAGGF